MIIILLIGYIILLINLFEIILLILIIYFSDFLCYLLMNGYIFLDLLFNFDYLIIISINSYYYNYYFIYFNCIYSILFEIGWSRFGNFIFDFDLLILIIWLFWIISFSFKSLLIWLIILLIIYCLILFSITDIFSLIHFILLSDNFECGFYPRLLSMLKYKFNYWIITIYFIIFEQELILVLLLLFGIKTLNENIILFILLVLLIIDLFI